MWHASEIAGQQQLDSSRTVRCERGLQLVPYNIKLSLPNVVYYISHKPPSDYSDREEQATLRPQDGSDLLSLFFVHSRAKRPIATAAAPS